MKIIEPETLSKENIFEIFDRVYMSPEYDEDGDIYINDNNNSAFIIVKPKIGVIKILSVFKENKETPRSEAIEQASMISSSYPITCYVTKNGSISFTHTIYTDGGVSEKNFILSVRKFFSIIRVVGMDDEYNLLGD